MAYPGTLVLVVGSSGSGKGVLMKRAKALPKDKIVLINLSGRGDKDVQQVAKILGTTL